ncbi:MAG TPA: YHS domain-containing protein [Candidatus Acidoferrum sp.]|nr:YHS domain-containing protein [Candidatus Acidoferrum sp.]
MPLDREQWLDLARKLDWDYSYVDERDVFPLMVSGRPWLPHAEWAEWDEPYRTSYAEYVTGQHAKETSVRAVREAVGRPEDYERLDASWLNVVKLHGATLPLAEFAAVVGNLRAARFGRDSAWRTMATFGALDELRHTQIPLLVFHDLVQWDRQFDWTHKFFHTNDWVAIAGRHLVDELLLASDPIEFAIGTNFVFETGFTNLQFIGLTTMARKVGDRMFEKMLRSIQTDEARHAQIGPAVLKILVDHDRDQAQALLDKWFWRSWRFFAVVTGFAMDYLTPVEHRTQSFAEFVEEWVLDQFDRMLTEFGLERPWYWELFLEETQRYHHMVYASAYTYRATTWFDFALPGPEERAWLADKYPRTWPLFDPVWQRITDRWQRSGPGVEWYTHGATPVAFCNLCQLVLCGGTPDANSALSVVSGGRKYIFCSEPCARIFQREPERYAAHKGVVARILAGEAPANLIELLHYFGLSEEMWGKDVVGGRYPWNRPPRPSPAEE